VVRAVRVHARAAAPEECCGFLIGRPGRVDFALRLTNQHRSPRTAFRVDPAEHIRVRRLLRLMRPAMEIVGVYHSHPSGPARPSARDVAEASYADWVHLIAGHGGRTVRCFRIAGGVVTAVSVLDWPGRSPRAAREP
jgi:proteasome lid subunit RPN8/RPN11